LIVLEYLSVERVLVGLGKSTFGEQDVGELLFDGYRIHDAEPPTLPIHPGKLPTDIDPPLSLPSYFPSTTAPSSRERWAKTPIYENLT